MLSGLPRGYVDAEAASVSSWRLCEHHSSSERACTPPTLKVARLGLEGQPCFLIMNENGIPGKARSPGLFSLLSGDSFFGKRFKAHSRSLSFKLKQRDLNVMLEAFICSFISGCVCVCASVCVCAFRK